MTTTTLPLLARLTAAAALATTPVRAEAAAPRPAEAPSAAEIMIIGDFHMANPGADIVNLKADDMLAPGRQAEIQKVADALARFRPTVVAAEWPAKVVAERYERYATGALPPSRNEVVQLGFRLARQTGARMIGIDVDGDFPFGPVQAWAQANGHAAVLDDGMAQIHAKAAAQDKLLREKGVAATLRHLNEPATIAADNGFYRTMLKVGAGEAQPGVDLLTAWYRRNFLICANLIQAVKPGDRAVVFYGAGHAFLLRQCVAETPGLKLVEANAWLPR